ncbi:MAG: hypothetical protein K9I35_08385 [Flavobacterium sp.]|jgi:hypothetical protein|nr:hypothetical protein [Flavobacterium sp.]
MPNTAAYKLFFDKVRESISNGTFAKLTLAKTIGNTQLMNIYIRTNTDEIQLKLALTFKFQTGEEVKIVTIEEGLNELIPYLNNPFLSAILFTIDGDVMMKLNKKRVATITEQAATFKNADPILLEYLSNK